MVSIFAVASSKINIDGFFANILEKASNCFSPAENDSPLSLAIESTPFGSAFIKSGVVIFIAAFCHNLIGYIAGWLIGTMVKMPEAKKRTISIEVGMQNAGLATVLAVKHFALIP